MNVTRITVVKNVYVNSRVNNGVVVVDRNNFLRGDTKRMRIAKGQDPFRHPGAMGQRIMPRPPARDIKPIKETRLPRPGVRPKALPQRQMEKVAADTEAKGDSADAGKVRIRAGQDAAENAAKAVG